MKEREKILDLWQRLRASGADGVLVTVVKTLGSSYRRPGARMLIAEGGERAGSISGGCLEDDLIRKAWWLSEKGPVVRRYDTTPDGEIGPSGEATGGFGLGCNGIIFLLIERVEGRSGHLALAALECVYSGRQEAWLAHALGAPGAVESIPLDRMNDQLKRHLEGLSASLLIRLESGQEVFLETLTPPVRLLLFGAGDDAVPLTELARNLGWQVGVFDGRAHYARRDKFPQAQQVAVRDASMSLGDLQIDSRTAAVIMTHSYSQDLNFLKGLAAAPLAYLGILGPRNRSERLLLEAGIVPEHTAALHGPAGLDIGADGPEQVALSIIAEIQASVNGRVGGPLRQRSGSIHARESDGFVAEPFVPTRVCA